ncbi:MAG TPA: serine--tRNA ligase [Acidimicrobiales bacterium]|nr:serine--tRNA ligase [Acidimicrobiales bacterium]
MIDIRRVRADLAGVRAALARRHDPLVIEQLDALAGVDAESRQLTAQRDELRAQVNTLSKQVGEAYRSGDRSRGDELKDESRRLGDEERSLAARVDELNGRVRDLLLRIPNLPSEQAPDGRGEDDNPVLRVVGYDPGAYADHQRVPHWDTGRELGILDNERAAKISGSMFTMVRGAGATLSRALCQLALDRNSDAFEEIRPPTLVLTSTLTATGQLPKFADEAYAVERDDLWAIPTAEVPLTSIYGGEILDEGDLPKRMMAYTPCYRREAGSAGRDTRGMLRGHEFDKVEVLAYTTPDDAPRMLDELLARCEASIAALGLAYRVIEICTGDMGQSHHRSFDIEAYAPGCDAWLEVSSVSWFSDYQARRANIRYRPGDGSGGTELVHTLNGSGLAVPRVWAAIVETYRQPDGSIRIPEVLLPYFRGQDVITPR